MRISDWSSDVCSSDLCAFSFVIALNYAAMWFPPNRFATLGGWAQTLGVVGGILGQAPLGYLVEAVGWRVAVIGLAAFGLALALATGLILRDRDRKSTRLNSSH